mgnify:CR=1 FL=1
MLVLHFDINRTITIIRDHDVKTGLFDSFKNVLIKYPHARIVLRTYCNDFHLVKDYFHDYNFVYLLTVWEDNMPNYYNTDSEKVMLNNEIKKLHGKTIIVIKEDADVWIRNYRNNNYGKIIYPLKNAIQMSFDDNDCFYSIDDQALVFKITTKDAFMNKNYYTNAIKKHYEDDEPFNCLNTCTFL